MSMLYTPRYPGIIAAVAKSGQAECGHRQNRGGGRIPLTCVRRKGHEHYVNHLHDVPPEYRPAPAVVDTLGPEYPARGLRP